jgi:hypothetical protein
MDFRLTHAMHDPAHCCTPGLFRALRRGARKMEKLDVTHQFGDTEVQFVGYQPLGGDDLRILQGIVAQTGLDCLLLTPTPRHPTAVLLRKGLNASGDAERKNGIVGQLCLRSLLHEVGMCNSSGSNIASAQASLKRLASVTLFVTRGTMTASCHMLSYAVDEDSGLLHVALNPQFAEAILGITKHTRIDLAEVRKLKSDAARVIHQRLCGFVDIGKSRKVSVETLSEYAWHDAASSAACQRKRRERVHKAVAEIAKCGWRVIRHSSEVYLFGRPWPEFSNNGHKSSNNGHKSSNNGHKSSNNGHTSL